jgi:LysR family transcriptional regulator, transcriptional activator of the cysJI operon
MTIKQLQIFVAVAEKENLTLAASSLYLAQPAVSHSLALLEEELGVPLFIRSHQRLHLSEEGKRLLPYAQSVLNGLTAFEAETANLAHKPIIRLASSLAFGERLLPEAIAGYPEKDKAEFHSIVAPSPEIFSLLEQGAVDFSFLETSVLPNGFEGKEVYADRLALVVKKDLVCPSILPRDEASSYSWLLRDSSSGTRLSFDNALAAEGMAVVPSLESSSNASLLAFAEKGLGIAVIPASLAEKALAEGSLKEVTLEGFSFPRSVFLVYRKQAAFSLEHRHFLAYLIQHFSLAE